MRVLIEIQSAVGARAGVGRYTLFLTRHLAETRHDNELAAFFFDFRRKGPPLAGPGIEFRPFRLLPGRWVQKSWKTVGWPPFDRLAGPADVYHFPNFILPPLRSGASVVTIHDLAFLRYPETIEEKNLAYLRRHIRRTVARADAIITVSRFTAQEAAELLDAAAERLFPIHSGLDPAMRRPPEEQIAAFRSRRGLNRPYLLSVGTLEPRKNYPFLIDVFERLAFEGELVIAGRPGWKFEPILNRIGRSRRRERIRVLEDLDESELPALYSGARAFVLPSLYEGFGFPPVEAMACGIPVVVSKGGALAEVCGEGAAVLAQFEIEAWVEAVQRVLDDEAWRERLVRRGLEQAGRYSWRDTALRTWSVYATAFERYRAERGSTRIKGRSA